MLDNTIPDAEVKKLNQQAIEDWQSLLQQEGEYLNELGYPTKLACDIIANWHWSDQKGWFAFIKDIWHLGGIDFVWEEIPEGTEYPGDNIYRYNISTTGWSGNESLIAAMQENTPLWNLTWVQSRRGGHYIFEVYNFKKEDQNDR